MNHTNTISIVCVCDNHYAVLLAALMKSIECNHHSGEKIEYFIVDDQISDQNKDRIVSSLNMDNTQIHWKPMLECLPAGVKLPTDKSSMPLNIYIRLFIPYFISENVERIIFLDVDMIVLEDISRLWHVDLQKNIIAAVQDQWIQLVSRWGGVSNYQDFGLTAESKYFNAGLLLIDIAKWKDADISMKILECINTHKELALFQDQYGLNAVLGNSWSELDPRWNRFAYSEEERPYLIHFTGRKPIYKTYEFRKDYQQIFFGYLNQTSWKNYKPIGETKRYLKKFTNMLQKLKNLVRPLTKKG